jgi:hypothetical protein
MSKKNQKQDALTAEVTPGSALVLHGKEYKLAFPFKSVVLYKQKTGDSLFNMESWKKLGDPENLLAAIWAALAVHHPELTYDEVSCLIDLSNVKAAEEAIVKCLASYFPTPKQAEGSASPNADAPKA